MAEVATIARPYAEAAFKSAGERAGQWAQQLSALGAVAADPQLRQFADNPRAKPDEVLGLLTGVANLGQLDANMINLLNAVIENGRLSALPQIAEQFQTLVNAQSGVSDATVYSAFPIDDAALRDVVGALERRFKRKLNAVVSIDPALIGGIRVVVGDEVLDTSVRARLEQMKVALTA